MRAIKAALLGNRGNYVNAPLPTTTYSSYGTNQGYGYQNYGYGSNSYSGAPFGSNLLATNTITTTNTLKAPYAPSLPMQQSLPISTMNTMSTMPSVSVEKRENAPVIHERIRREEVEEIQPVIHREREKTEVHKITQPIFTNATTGIITEERSLPAQYSEFRTPSMPIPIAPLPSSTESLSAQKFRIEKAPVVFETQRTKVVEEIQPVVYKEVVQPHITKWTQPIYEHIVEPTTYVTETLPMHSQFNQQFPMLGQWQNQQFYQNQQFMQNPQFYQNQQQQLPLSQQYPIQNQWQSQQLPIKSQQFPIQGQQFGQSFNQPISQPLNQQLPLQQPLTQQPLAQQALNQQLPAVVQQPINNVLKDKLGFPLNNTSTTSFNSAPLATTNLGSNLLGATNVNTATPNPLVSY